MPFTLLVFRYLNYLFCGDFFKAVFEKFFGVLNDCLSLICVYDASWYFHILQIWSNKHLVPLVFVSSIIQPFTWRLCSPCAYYIVSDA